MLTKIRRLAIGLPVLLATATASAQVTVGGPSNATNCFPFACKGGPAFPGTRYQQVYSASAFSGPIDITGLTFFRGATTPGPLNAGTFDLYLSTTSAAVDALDTGDFDANLGAPTTLFGSFTIGGAAPDELTFTGGPYHYDPAAGNLLLDIRVGPMTYNDIGVGAFFVARSGPAGGNYSRAQNFGTQDVGYGLDTRFEVAAVPEPATVLLLAGGLAALAAVARRRRPS